MDAGTIHHDVSTRAFLEYVFADGTIYRVTDPVSLDVKIEPRGDNHRIVDASGMVHYVPLWRVVRWEEKAQER